MKNPYKDAYANKALINLEQDYENWVQATRQSEGSLFWRTRGDREYLCKRTQGLSGPIEHSLGPRNEETEAQMEIWQNAKSRVTSLSNKIKMLSATCRHHRIPYISAVLGKVLRQLDIDDQNGNNGVMVVGTNALLV